ncbi:acyloxyacyl hydrolase [Photobacterium sp. 1_MG-2023]|uniref:acyloxyacyl hydrolase n=1 Tax=Photobacterium sp. 1_MG-2023 TaxID=3062646 RepID=UPI0026E14340|nr:acyloxyacyl hydrolase [Photobacterium sp. 1_MG-2023]MDO6705531.1 acyloxyacyl hydrolase [Photobacterium sp. 1_MG-2023]
MTAALNLMHWRTRDSELSVAAVWGRLLLIFCGFCLSPLSAAEILNLESLSIRARISEQTLLGEDAPENFEEYSVAANYGFPWQPYVSTRWAVRTRLMVSGGLLRGAGESALVISAIPEVTLGTEDSRFLLDLGAGGALFSRHRFGVQDFGGPFQFALTFGVSVPVYESLGVGYRFLHYSDAGLNGSDTTGADFHMIEFSYRF